MSESYDLQIWLTEKAFKELKRLYDAKDEDVEPLFDDAHWSALQNPGAWYADISELDCDEANDLLWVLKNKLEHAFDGEFFGFAVDSENDSYYAGRVNGKLFPHLKSCISFPWTVEFPVFGRNQEFPPERNPLNNILSGCAGFYGPKVAAELWKQAEELFFQDMAKANRSLGVLWLADTYGEYVEGEDEELLHDLVDSLPNLSKSFVGKGNGKCCLFRATKEEFARIIVDFHDLKSLHPSQFFLTGNTRFSPRGYGEYKPNEADIETLRGLAEQDERSALEYLIASKCGAAPKSSDPAPAAS